jgi:O-antigen/teichoic acid export membrane protein
VRQTQKYNNFFDTGALTDNIKTRSLRGGLLTMGAAGISLVLRLVGTAILARILIPEYFGLITMVTAFISIAENCRDFGLSTATVQSKEISHQQVSTLFWLNATGGVVIMAIICGASLLIAWFYNDSRLIWITIALSTRSFWAGITAQHQAILWRKMQFGALAVVNLAAILLSIIVAVVLSLMDYGFWALVWRDVSNGLFLAIGSWLFCRWLPGLPSRTKDVGKMLKIGADVTVFNIIVFFTDTLDLMLIGKFFGAGPLGIYRQGSQLAQLPVGFLSDPMQTVAQPALTVLQNDHPRYREYYEKLLKSLTFVSMPLMVFLLVNAHDVILILLGRQWLEAVIIFRIFILAGLIRPALRTVGVVMLACGKTRRYLVIGMVNSLSIVLGIGAGFRWGATGIAIGYVFANYLLFAPIAYVALKNTPVSFGLFLSCITPSVICSFTMGLVLTIVAALNPVHNSYYAVAVSFGIAIVSYLASWIVMPRGKAKLSEMFWDFASLFRASA